MDSVVDPSRSFISARPTLDHGSKIGRFRDCQSDQGSVGAPGDVGPPGGVIALNLTVWLPALFVLGLVSMAACLAFAEGCARI
jgi:hypothetical protein